MRAVVVASLLMTAPAFAQRVSPKAAGWHSDYAAARAEARRTGKPLFVAFRCEP
jgi:hypothetical protein